MSVAITTEMIRAGIYIDISTMSTDAYKDAYAALCTLRARLCKVDMKSEDEAKTPDKPNYRFLGINGWGVICHWNCGSSYGRGRVEARKVCLHDLLYNAKEGCSAFAGSPVIKLSIPIGPLKQTRVRLLESLGNGDYLVGLHNGESCRVSGARISTHAEHLREKMAQLVGEAKKKSAAISIGDKVQVSADAKSFAQGRDAGRYTSPTAGLVCRVVDIERDGMVLVLRNPRTQYECRVHVSDASKVNLNTYAVIGTGYQSTGLTFEQAQQLAEAQAIQQGGRHIVAEVLACFESAEEVVQTTKVVSKSVAIDSL